MPSRTRAGRMNRTVVVENQLGHEGGQNRSAECGGGNVTVLVKSRKAHHHDHRCGTCGVSWSHCDPDCESGGEYWWPCWMCPMATLP